MENNEDVYVEVNIHAPEEEDSIYNDNYTNENDDEKININNNENIEEKSKDSDSKTNTTNHTVHIDINDNKDDKDDQMNDHQERDERREVRDKDREESRVGSRERDSDDREDRRDRDRDRDDRDDRRDRDFDREDRDDRREDRRDRDLDRGDDKKSSYNRIDLNKGDKSLDKHELDRKNESSHSSRSKTRYSPYPPPYYKPHYGESPPHYPPPQYMPKSRSYHNYPPPSRSYHSDYPPYPDPYYVLPTPPPEKYEEPPYYPAHHSQPSTYPPHPAIIPQEKDYQRPPQPSAPAPPTVINGEVASKVIHFRNVVSSITQQDVMSLCSSFGEVYQVVMLSDKNQALVQMAELSSAIQFLQYYSDIPINIRGRKVYARFSRHPELRHNNMIANKVILVTFQSELPLYQLTIDIVWQLFSYYGTIDKIVMVNKEKSGEGKSNSRQALVQFGNQSHATAALDTLTGESVFIGDPPTKTSLHIQYSNLTSLIVKQQTSDSRDYTESLTPKYQSHYPVNPPPRNYHYNYNSYPHPNY